MRFIQAANYTPVAKRGITLLVVHDMEAKPTGLTAENVASFFHNQPRSNNGSSAHYCVDDNSIVQCVHDHDVAWAAPDANHQGLHYEFAGYAKYGRKNWLDPYGQKMLKRGAKKFAKKAHKLNIPIEKLEVSQIKKGYSGICGHKHITAAFGPIGGHTDPGDNFPWTYFIELVQKYHHRRYPWCKKH